MMAVAEVKLDIPALLALCERLLARWDSDYITTPDLKVFPAHVRLVKGLCEAVQGCPNCRWQGIPIRLQRGIGALYQCSACGHILELLAAFAADPQVRKMLEEGA